MTFIVEGRRFTQRKLAIVYAKHQAKLLERDVKVLAEIEQATPVRMVREWIATLHPPGTKITTAIKQPLNVQRRA